mmetsp:Transcript_4985/g.12252  ORF Transcript_4985/g.12252 Transcript_4985/m.12252 type:complete len:243 (+) Transcript_4985:3985-4713(+)
MFSMAMAHSLSASSCAAGLRCAAEVCAWEAPELDICMPSALPRMAMSPSLPIMSCAACPMGAWPCTISTSLGARLTADEMLKKSKWADLDLTSASSSSTVRAAMISLFSCTELELPRVRLMGACWPFFAASPPSMAAASLARRLASIKVAIRSLACPSLGTAGGAKGSSMMPAGVSTCSPSVSMPGAVILGPGSGIAFPAEGLMEGAPGCTIDRGICGIATGIPNWFQGYLAAVVVPSKVVG